MSKVAVIVPVYNAEETLPSLLASLRAQTLRDFAVIFSDDGSSDRSREMIRTAAAEDERIHLVECAHGGPGAARNSGLDLADVLKVDFITFLDADDHIVPDALEASVRLLEESGADIVHYPWAADDASLAEACPLSQPSIYVWNKVYRRSAVEGVRFIDSCFAEDLAYFLETDARRPKRVSYPRALYVHAKRAGSLWESRSTDDVIVAMGTVVGRLSDFFAADPPPNGFADWKHVYLPKLLNSWLRCVKRLPRTRRTRQRAEFIKRLRALRSAGQLPLICRGMLRFRVRCMVLLFSAPFSDVLGNIVGKVRGFWRSCVYGRHLRRIRRGGDRPVRVLFLVSEISKWKTRALFELMQESRRYAPVVGVGLDDCETRLAVAERLRLIESRLDWFRRRAIACEPVYDVEANASLDLRRLRPDVVFYQQPWQIPARHRPDRVSRFAMTFYVPYCMADFGNLDAECLLPFFGQLFAYFVQSRPWAALYRAATHGAGCRFVATGHPIIDTIRGAGEPMAERDLVIYAPHWTFRYPGRNDLYPYGTFNGNGREILAYAKSHPDWHWVFKPHPLLRAALVERGLMTKAEADAYYAEWERLGTACYDADYPSLFMRSRAMITDSGSFLVEYGATGSPLVHLKPPDSRVETLAPNRRLFASYHVATNLDEMAEAFGVVLERREDPRRDERLAAAREAGLFGANASKRILRYLDAILHKGKERICRD